MSYQIEIRNIADLQRRYLALLRDFKANGLVGRTVKRVLVATHRTAVNVTHVDTGALRGSHIAVLSELANMVTGTVSINPATKNPRHGDRPFEYGIEEHDRGGSHSFYEIAFNRTTIPAAVQAIEKLTRAVDSHFS
jgi:hypothetical protein